METISTGLDVSTLYLEPQTISGRFGISVACIFHFGLRRARSIVRVTITKDPCRSQPENVTSTGLYEADNWKRQSAETLFLGIPGSPIHVSCNRT